MSLLNLFQVKATYCDSWPEETMYWAMDLPCGVIYGNCRGEVVPYNCIYCYGFHMAPFWKINQWPKQPFLYWIIAREITLRSIDRTKRFFIVGQKYFCTPLSRNVAGDFPSKRYNLFVRCRGTVPLIFLRSHNFKTISKRPNFSKNLFISFKTWKINDDQ